MSLWRSVAVSPCVRSISNSTATCSAARTNVAPGLWRISDYPLITPDRWMKDFEDAGFKPEVMPGILKDNAVRLLGLAAG